VPSYSYILKGTTHTHTHTHYHSCVMGSDQRFSLKWNNYQSHLVTAFESLLGESDFVDVTLGVEGRRLSAHKMLLSACSPYFRELLKGNPCQHPIIVLRDIRYDDLHALLQFMYNGEVNVAQDQLNSFLKSAEHLKVRGLTDNTDDDNNGTDTASSKDSSSASMNANSVNSPTSVPAKKKRPLAAAGSNNDGSGSSGPPMKRPSSTASAPAAGIASMSLHHKKEAEPVKQEVIDINDDQYDEPDVGYDDGGGGGGVVDHHAGVVEQYEGGGGGGYGDEGGTLAVPDGGDIDQHTDGQGWRKTGTAQGGTSSSVSGGNVLWRGDDDSLSSDTTGLGWSAAGDISGRNSTGGWGDLYGSVLGSGGSSGGGASVDASGNKPTWFCDICNKTFSNGGAWYNHKKFHTGETVCKVCSKIMGTVSSLNRHVKNEHGDTLGQDKYSLNA